jgi:PST family polysaccharide transporter/lipopolysaccharide exporter
MSAQPGTGSGGDEDAKALLPSADVSRSELKEATFKSLRWATVARLAAELTAVCSAVLLAHLVPPAEVGRVAVATIVGALAMSLANEGVGSALVRRRELERAHVEGAALLSLLVGSLLTVVTLFVVPLVTTPLFGHETTELFRLLSPMFLIAAVGIVPLAMLERRLDFQRISIVEICSVQGGVLTSIVLAIAGLDAEAYIFGTIAATTVWATLLVILGPSAFPRWRPQQMREIAGFGLPAGLAGAAQVGYGNIDFLVLGGTISPSNVGFYYRAYALGVQYQDKISAIITRLVYPVYSRAEDMGHMRDLRARVMRVNAAVIYPLLALFIATAPLVVPWLFGEQWEPAVVPAQILTIAGMARMINNGTPALVLAAGQPRALLAFNLYRVITLGLMVLVASPFGLNAVCAAVAAFQIITLVGSYRIMLSRLVGVSVHQLVRDIGPAVVASAAMLVVAFPLTDAVSGAELPTLLTVSIVGALSAPVYLVALRMVSRPAWNDVILIIRKVLIPRRWHKAPAPQSAAAGG